MATGGYKNALFGAKDGKGTIVASRTEDEQSDFHLLRPQGGLSPSFNFLAPQAGEVLPPKLCRNHGGLLLRKGLQIMADIVGCKFMEREVSFMHEHLVIANFMEGYMVEHCIQDWVAEITEIIAPWQIDHYALVGYGLWILKINNVVITWIDNL